MSIQIENLWFSRQQRSVLGPIDLHIPERRVGIIGMNGSGKSTLARIVTGLLQPKAGFCRVNGVDVWADRKAALDTVGMIFQNPDHQIIFPTCEEEVAFGLTQQGVSKVAAREHANKILAQFGHADWATRSTHELSQGQRHLLCLMAVLVMEPKLLVLDEPYAGLDMPTSLHLHKNLSILDQQVLLITHDLNVLTDFDRVIWIDDGQIEQDGAPSDVIVAYKDIMRSRVLDHA